MPRSHRHTRQLHDVQVRLLAFLAQHYHVAPHASLMGVSPVEVYETAPCLNEPVDESSSQRHSLVHGRRRVRRDGTLEVGGLTFETRAGFLAGRVVAVGRSLLDPTSDPWIEHEGQRYIVGRVDPEGNARRKKHGPATKRASRGLDVSFKPQVHLSTRSWLGASMKEKRHDSLARPVELTRSAFQQGGCRC